jgi:hypothetical protein
LTSAEREGMLEATTGRREVIRVIQIISHPLLGILRQSEVW